MYVSVPYATTIRKALRIVVAYGTETYNSEGLAHESCDILAERGYQAEALDLEAFEPSILATADVFLVITSTFGDGDPPSNAEDAHAFLMSDEASSLIKKA